MIDNVKTDMLLRLVAMPGDKALMGNYGVCGGKHIFSWLNGWVCDCGLLLHKDCCEIAMMG